MALDVGPEDVGAEDGRSSRRRGSPLPLLLLAIIVVVIVWLLWQFLGRMPVRDEITEVTSTSTIDASVPAAPPELEVPTAAEETVPPAAEDPTVPDVVGDLIVSRGTPEVSKVEMPDIIGLTQTAAVAKVKAAGLKPYILYGTDQTYAGRVGNQWPLVGTKIPKGSEGFVQVMIVR